MSLRKELTIATPCFNEQESLPAYFKRIEYTRGELHKRGWATHLLLIDDGSSDNTQSMLRAYAASHDAEVVAHPRNTGYGAAIKTALALAATDWVVFVDADSNYDQAIILDLERRVSATTGILNVSIFAPSGGSGFPWYRMLLSKTASLIYRLLLPRLTRGVFTMTCGFRWYRRELAASFFPREDNFAATAELLVRALASGARVEDVPARNRRRESGVSKMRFLAVSLTHLSIAARALLGGLGPPEPVEAHLRKIGR